MQNSTHGILMTTQILKDQKLTASIGFNQIINEPTHILNNFSSSINLVFTSQPNHSPLHCPLILLSIEIFIIK